MIPYKITPESIAIFNPDGGSLAELKLVFSKGTTQTAQWKVERLEETKTGWTGHTGTDGVTVKITKAISGDEGHLIVELCAPGPFSTDAEDVVYFQGSGVGVAAPWVHGFIPDANDGAFPVTEGKTLTLTSQAEMKLPLGVKEELWMIAPPPHVIGLGDAEGAGFSLSIPESLPADATQCVIADGKLELRFVCHAAICDGGRFPRVYIDLNVGGSRERGSGRHDALARHLSHARALGLVKKEKPQPAWWHNPLYCTWGDQVRLASKEQAVPIPTHMSLTRERILGWADKIRSFYDGEVNFIIDDGYFVGFGDFRLKPELYPTVEAFRGLIAELQKRRFRVILWYTPFWLAVHSPIVQEHSEWLLHKKDGTLRDKSPIWHAKYCYDWTHPGVRERQRENIRFLLGELGADGMKIDMTYANPGSQEVVRHDPAWAAGCGYLQRVLEIIHEEVRRIKPGAFTTINGIESYLQPLASAVRLNDLFDEKSAAAWYSRAELVNRVMPGVAIDVDGWPSGAGKLREYPFVASVFGAPVTYYLDGTEIGMVTFGDEEINRMAAVWHTYAHAPVREEDVITIDAEKGVFERRDVHGGLRAISLGRSAFVTYAGAEIRVASNIGQEVAVPLEKRAKPGKAVCVYRDGRKAEVAFRVEEEPRRVVLKVEDAGKGVLYYALTA